MTSFGQGIFISNIFFLTINNKNNDIKILLFCITVKIFLFYSNENNNIFDIIIFFVIIIIIKIKKKKEKK